MGRDKAVAVSIFLVAGLALGAMLFFLNPATTKLYPRCVFHELTGLYCPGCGSTRALHCLLHGEFREAIRNNALTIVVLPLFGVIFLARAVCRRSTTTASRWRWGWLGLLLAVIVVFGVVRNIRRLPFSLLAPPVGAVGK